MKFQDRAEAGRYLAERLLHLRDAQPLVLALPGVAFRSAFLLRGRSAHRWTS